MRKRIIFLVFFSFCTIPCLAETKLDESVLKSIEDQCSRELGRRYRSGRECVPDLIGKYVFKEYLRDLNESIFKEAVLDCKKNKDPEQLAICLNTRDTDGVIAEPIICQEVEQCLQRLEEKMYKVSTQCEYYSNDDNSRHLRLDCEAAFKQAIKELVLKEYRFLSTRDEIRARRNYDFWHTKLRTRSRNHSLYEITHDPVLFTFNSAVVILFIGLIYLALLQFRGRKDN